MVPWSSFRYRAMKGMVLPSSIRVITFWICSSFQLSSWAKILLCISVSFPVYSFHNSDLVLNLCICFYFGMFGFLAFWLFGFLIFGFLKFFPFCIGRKVTKFIITKFQEISRRKFFFFRYFIWLILPIERGFFGLRWFVLGA